MSPFFSLLSFLRKGVLFHHDLLVPPGSGWGFGACLPSFSSLLPVLVSLLLSSLVPVLVSLLLSSLVPVLVSLLLSSFFPQERGSVPS